MKHQLLLLHKVKKKRTARKINPLGKIYFQYKSELYLENIKRYEGTFANLVEIRKLTLRNFSVHDFVAVDLQCSKV